MAEKTIKKTKFDGEEVEIVGPTYEEGKPDSISEWRNKMRDRKEMLAYLATGERYWYSSEPGYGSEKRKTKA